MKSLKYLLSIFLSAGSLQLIIAMNIAQYLYPGYNIFQNYISDLGVGSTAWIFNSSVILTGISMIAGSYLSFSITRKTLFSILLSIAGIGAIGVGLFPENIETLHFIFSSITFVFGSFASIAAFTFVKKPFSYFPLFTGILALAAIGLFQTGNYLSLGPGGMERVIVYPELLMLIFLGVYLAWLPDKMK